jgi:hypothetical protein
MAKIKISNARVRQALESGFSVAVDSQHDSSRDARVYTVYTPYGSEKSYMTLTGTDVPRRTSNMCHVVQDQDLMNREASTPSELLGQFFIDLARVATYAEKHGIEPYDYANKAVDEINSLPVDYVNSPQETRCPSLFDHIQLKATAVFSYDIPKPRLGETGADAAILTGDMAHIWHWTRMAKMPLQESMEKVFCDCIGAKDEGSFDKRITSSMKRIRDLPVFHVTNVTKDGHDFTNRSRLAVLTMKSVPCILEDAIVRQINLAMCGVYKLNEIPVAPLSIFHAVSGEHRDGLVEDQIEKLERLVEGNTQYLNNVLKIVRELKPKFEDSVSYHRHLVCSQCGQDVTDQFSIRQEVNDPTLSHCQAGIRNVGKFVALQTKAIRPTFSLECCRQVRRFCQGLPQYEKEGDRIGIFTEAEASQIYERPCVIADSLQPMMCRDIANHRAKYDNVSVTVYILVPFDRQATLERLRSEGVENPEADLLTVHNVVECIVPLHSSTEGLVEYRFEAVAFRGKQTLSVQAYGSTPVGHIPLFDPATTTKRLSTEILQEDGRVKCHEYEHTLNYKSKLSLKTRGTMFSTTNFKRYNREDEQVEVPNGGMDNWSRFGYTLVGVMAVNLVRCAKYAGRYLMAPEHLQFEVISDTREKTRKSREHSRKGLKRTAETCMKRENELTEELNKLQSTLQEEKKRVVDLSSELTTANIMLEYHQLMEGDYKCQLESLTKSNEAMVRDYDALKAARAEEVSELESRIISLTTQLQKKRERKRSKRHKSLPEQVSGQIGPDIMWVQELGASIIAV